MGVKEAPKTVSEPTSGSFPATDAASFSSKLASEGLKVVTLSPATASQPDIDPNANESLRSDPYLGCTIDGRYKVEARLGEGGMGVVYRCSHKIIGKKVAMKVLRADLARDTEATERFLNEAKAASSIGNPHIIDISDFGQFPDGSTYFVMEFLEGVSLAETLAEGAPLPTPRILRIAGQLAEGLSAAHQGQIVHRDLKPDNIFLVPRGKNPDFVKILDFGIAKVSTAEGKLTRAGAVFGTPHYMSPEQAAGAPVDHRGDIYSLGVILYELACGRVPFDADNFMGILTQHMYKSPVPLRALVPKPEEISASVEAIILKCLSKKPEDRYASMDELRADVQKIEDGEVPDAVAELVQRSDSFNVPPDYFAEHGAAVTAEAPTTEGVGIKNRWPLIAALAGVAVTVLIVIATLAKSSPSDAASGATNKVEPKRPTGLNADSKPPIVEVAPTMQRVVLAVEPLDAHAFIGTKDLGSSPVFVEVPAGGQATVEIRRDGYEPQRLVLDGSEGKKSIKLVKTATTPSGTERTVAPKKVRVNPRPKATLPAKSKPSKPKQTIGGSEIIDPWD